MLPLFVCKKSRTELEIFVCEQIWRMRRYYEGKKRKKQNIWKKISHTNSLVEKDSKKNWKKIVLVLCSGEAHNVFFWGLNFFI